MSTNDALLKQVNISAEDDNLVARFEIDGNIPGSGAYVVGLVAASEDYSSQRRLGIEFMNGEAISFYSFNHSLSAEENYDIKGVEHSGNVITGELPDVGHPRPQQRPRHDGLQRSRWPGVPIRRAGERSPLTPRRDPLPVR